MQGPGRRAWLGAAATAAALLAGWLLRAPAPAPQTAAAVLKPFDVWSVYDGYIESRDVRNIASQLDTEARIVELVADGTRVREGDVLVQFDNAQSDRDIVQLDRDFRMAEHELTVLTNATIPIESCDLELQLAEKLRQYSNEVVLLDASRELRQEDLISGQELAQQQVKAQAAEAVLTALRQKRDLMQRYQHPAAVEKAALTRSSLQQELALARRRMSNCVIRAPADGVVSLKALALGGEYRTVREGDSVWRNQPFLTIPDMSNLVMRCEVPEGELTRVQAGCGVTVKPLAYPDLSLAGTVEAVGGLAHTMYGRGAGKFFSTVIRIDTRDERLRSGMSAQARILSYASSNALLVPRAAIGWVGDQPGCYVLSRGRQEHRPLRTGMANDAEIEVIEGLKPGEQVVVK
jgi:HlyD family secretion protein